MPRWRGLPKKLLDRMLRINSEIPESSKKRRTKQVISAVNSVFTRMTDRHTPNLPLVFSNSDWHIEFFQNENVDDVCAQTIAGKTPTLLARFSTENVTVGRGLVPVGGLFHSHKTCADCEARPAENSVFHYNGYAVKCTKNQICRWYFWYDGEYSWNTLLIIYTYSWCHFLFDHQTDNHFCFDHQTGFETTDERSSSRQDEPLTVTDSYVAHVAEVKGRGGKPLARGGYHHRTSSTRLSVPAR